MYDKLHDNRSTQKFSLTGTLWDYNMQTDTELLKKLADIKLKQFRKSISYDKTNSLGNLI